MNSMLWSCHALDFKWLFSHGGGICTGWIKITKMMKKSLFWEQLITSLSHPAPPMTFSLSLSDTHTHTHPSLHLSFLSFDWIGDPFILIYQDLFSPSLFYLPVTVPIFQTHSSICLNSFTLTLSPSQSCVKQVSKAGMLRGKKDHHEDEQLLLITHMHRGC